MAYYIGVLQRATNGILYRCYRGPLMAYSIGVLQRATNGIIYRCVTEGH